MIKDMAITVMWANLCLLGLGVFIFLLVIIIITITQGRKVYLFQLDELRKRRRDESGP